MLPNFRNRDVPDDPLLKTLYAGGKFIQRDKRAAVKNYVETNLTRDPVTLPELAHFANIANVAYRQINMARFQDPRKLADVQAKSEYGQYLRQLAERPQTGED